MTTVAVAGATGRLGHLVVLALLRRGATVKALVRPGTAADKLAGLEGAAIVEVDYDDAEGLKRALAGSDVVVSAANGLYDVIVDMQTALLEAAVGAGVKRFIPTDYTADFTRLSPGENRNFDLRREFRQRLLAASIPSTSVQMGGFMDLLLWGRGLDTKSRVMNHWGTPDQPLNYTTMADTAEITAEVALDPDAPPILRIAGDTVTARQIAETAGAVLGVPFTLNRLGSIDELAALIDRERREHPETENELFPRFQQLQYTHNMQSGRATLAPLDNRRYPGLRLTTLRGLLEANAARLG